VTNAGVEKCLDADWCTMAPDACGANSVCSDNLAPLNGYSCQCRTGMELIDPTQPNGGCRKIDPCRTAPCAGSERCDASSGGGDECVRCAIIGKWPEIEPTEEFRTCWCPNGYGLGPDGTCVDMDGCTDVPCAQNAACKDKAAPDVASAREPIVPWKAVVLDESSRSCVCLPGFTGNGESCAGSDGVALGANGVAADEAGEAFDGIDAGAGNAKASASISTDAAGSDGTLISMSIVLCIIIGIGLIGLIVVRYKHGKVLGEEASRVQRKNSSSARRSSMGASMLSQGGQPRAAQQLGAQQFANPAFVLCSYSSRHCCPLSSLVRSDSMPL